MKDLTSETPNNRDIQRMPRLRRRRSLRPNRAVPFARLTSWGLAAHPAWTRFPRDGCSTRMEIIGISDGQAWLQALLGGQIDMLRGVTEQQRVLFEKSDKYNLQDIPTGNWRGIAARRMRLMASSKDSPT